MTARHRYGPHQPEAAPNSVTVLSPSRRFGGSGSPQPEVRAIPAGLVKQRADMNELARRQGAGEGTFHECTAKGREVWVPGDYCPLCRTRVVASS